MFNKNENKLGLVNSICILILLSYAAYSFWSRPKTGCILIKDVYNGFELKKDLEKKFLIVKNARQKSLDSLELNLKFIANKIRQEKEKDQEEILLFNNKRDEYLQKKQAMEEDNNALTNQYDTEILTQLNQYITDFGSDKNYTYIFGKDSNGSIMYDKESEDITKEVIQYINQKYNGKTIK